MGTFFCCIAPVTDVILATSCNSASREYTLAGRNVYQELICLLNHDTGGCDTTKKVFLLWFLLCKLSAAYLAGEVRHCLSSSQVCETLHLSSMIG